MTRRPVIAVVTAPVANDDVHAEIGDLAAQRSELEEMVSAGSCQR
jgi:hypothetical protein